MKILVYHSDSQITDKIAEIIAINNKNQKLSVSIANSIDELTEDSNIVIMEDSNGWENVMAELSESSVKCFIITSEKVTKELYDKVRSSGGEKAISINNIDEELKVIISDLNEVGLDEIEIPVSKESQIKREKLDSKQYEYKNKVKKFKGTIIVFTRNVGGAGTTNLAANTAVSLQKAGLKTVAIDLDLDNSTLSNKLHLGNDLSIKDWVKNSFQEEEKSLLSHSSGLKVIPGLLDKAEAPIITDIITEQILSKLGRRFDAVIVDTGIAEIESKIVAMHMADIIFVVQEMDMTATAKTIDLIEHLKDYHVDTKKVKLILNKAASGRTSTKESDYINRIPVSHLVTIGDDGHGVKDAVNEGELAAFSRLCPKFSKGVKTIVDYTLGIEQIKEKPRTQTVQRKFSFFARA